VGCNLGSIRSQLQPVVDQSEQGGERPDDRPDGDVTELSNHFGVVCDVDVEVSQLSSARAAVRKRKLTGKVRVLDQAQLSIDFLQEAPLSRITLSQAHWLGTRLLSSIPVRLDSTVVCDVLLDVWQAKLGKGVDRLVRDGICNATVSDLR
jgi:hypothetical protein